MSRKRLTQIFPFLLPLRKWQRKKFFYFKMRLDGYRYAQKKSEKILPNLAFETSIPMLNRNSGFDMKYQFNKVHKHQCTRGYKRYKEMFQICSVEKSDFPLYFYILAGCTD